MPTKTNQFSLMFFFWPFFKCLHLSVNLVIFCFDLQIICGILRNTHHLQRYMKTVLHVQPKQSATANDSA